jgi:uncharacterized protein (DUF1810 family)
MYKVIKFLLFTIFICCLSGKTNATTLTQPSSASFNLKRFHDVQTGELLGRVERELQAGNKTAHWIWYISPQLIGLGTSPQSLQYSIKSLDEAKAYLADSVLHNNLIHHTQLILAHKDSKPLQTIFGTSLDVAKFISSMTLFNAAEQSEQVFVDALNYFNSGNCCQKTLKLLVSEATEIPTDSASDSAIR